MKKFLFLLALCLFAGQAGAVKAVFVSNGGVNNSSCGTMDAPCATVAGTNSASSKVSPGDYIFVLPGSYGCISVSTSGTAGQPNTPVHIYGAGITHFNPALGNGCGNNGLFINANVHDVDIETLNFDGPFTGAGMSATSGGNYDILIKGNTVSGGSHGGLIFVGLDCWNFTGNVVHDVQGTGQTSGITSYEPVVNASCAAGWDGSTDGQKNHETGNKVWNFDLTYVSTTDGNCILGADDFRDTQNAPHVIYSDGVVINDNQVGGCGGRGIEAFQSDNVIIQNNSVSNDCSNTTVCGTAASPKPEGEIACEFTSNCQVLGNYILGSQNVYAVHTSNNSGTPNQVNNNTFCAGLGTTNFVGGGTTTSGNVSACPKFVNPTPGPGMDLRIQP